jgi:hypothetical protein
MMYWRASLDRLVAQGVITGYTVEPPPLYLVSRLPALTYHCYANDPVSENNLQRLSADLQAFRPELTLRPLQGNVRRADGSISRSDQLRMTARFETGTALEAALDLIGRRYLAGSGAWLPGSWQYPDVRVTGINWQPPGTTAATAHRLSLGRDSAVVLSLSHRPPLRRMRSYQVFLLERWHGYLSGIAS